MTQIKLNLLEYGLGLLGSETYHCDDTVSSVLLFNKTKKNANRKKTKTEKSS